MSVPQTLILPHGVSATRIATARTMHAVHMARAQNRIGSILLIPGWTGSKEDFTPILPMLAAQGYDVVAYDQRGQFETPGEHDDDYSLEALAEDAFALARASFRPGPLHILGHSFGGLVAQALATTHRSDLATLSLVCSGPGALGDSPTRPLQRMVNALGKHPLLQIHEIRNRGMKHPAQITAFLTRRFTSNSAVSLRAMTQHLIDAPDVIDEVAATRIPAFVARGAEDDAWLFDAQDDMAARLGTEVVVLPSAAHSPAVEAPEELVEAWLPFLQSHGSN